MEILEEIKEIICEQLGVRPEEIKPEASISDDLGADSLNAVKIVVALEETFNIKIPDEDTEKLQTVGDMIKYVEVKVNETRANEPGGTQ